MELEASLGYIVRTCLKKQNRSSLTSSQGMDQEVLPASGLTSEAMYVYFRFSWFSHSWPRPMVALLHGTRKCSVETKKLRKQVQGQRNGGDSTS
jgi:hypothetical protein